jgi:Ca2+-binding RTX toxin-like protein
VAGAGDVNGDSKSDLLVGAPRQTVGGNAHQGQAFIFSGADGILLHTLDHPTPKDDAHFGQVLASAGDVNGDGKTDLLIGAWNQSVDGNPGQGQAVLFVSRPTTPVCFGMPATIVGTAGNDVLRGTPGNDVIVGLAGHDVIDGRGGDDLICGGDGNDTLRGGTGNDKLSGGEDNDILWGGAGDDLLEGGPGRDRASGGSGNDILRGGEGDDMLNVVDGAGGNDIADGGSHVNGDRCAADNRDTVQNCNL